ncbi:MAG: DNA internalization-related competence protein ComEC/Rec2 [Ruminococcaceae bacterium]|nr:DNA internalization-related competence protein ComEC/Rec2 [Oscillospiraceae bacterium]
MRKLVWLVLGFVLGCASGIWVLSGAVLAFTCLGVMAVGVLLTVFGRKHGAILRVGVLCVGCFIGMLWLYIYDVTYLTIPRSYDKQTVNILVEASDYGYPTAYGQAVDGTVTLEEKSYSVKCYLDSAEDLKPGDKIYGSFQLHYTSLWGEESATYHQGKGIVLLAYPMEEPIIYHKPEIPGKFFATELRQNITGLLEEMFPERTRGFAAALLLGRGDRMSQADDSAFRISGIRHIIAVSGLHVSVLFSMLQFLLQRRRILSGVIGLPLLFLFAAVAGFTPSIIRACVMHGIMILSRMLKKDYDPPTSLAFAVLVILLMNPLALTAVGFQLSVGCVVGIFLFTKPLATFFLKKTFLGHQCKSPVLSAILYWTAQSLSISLGTLSVTAPLSAWYFGSISLVSIFTNLICLWMVSVSFYGIVICCVLGAFWLPLGSVFAWAVSLPMMAVLTVARLFAAIPFASVSVDNQYVAAWLIFTYVLLGTFLIMGRKAPWIFVGCVITALAGCLTLAVVETATEAFRVTVLDVGQGQCVILQSRGQCYVVDCGGDYASTVGTMAAQNLRSQGIHTVDGLILTHFDVDHAGGTDAFLSQMPTKMLYIPDAPDHNGIRELLERDYPELLLTVNRERVLPCGEGTVRIFPAEDRESGNESSLCILYQAKNCDILITGDRNQTGEKALLAEYDLPDLEVLVVGHHGAENSAGFELLYNLTPDVAVISVGEKNLYHHPSYKTLERLKFFGCVILRTDQHGTITIRG